MELVTIVQTTTENWYAAGLSMVSEDSKYEQIINKTSLFFSDVTSSMSLNTRPKSFSATESLYRHIVSRKYQ